MKIERVLCEETTIKKQGSGRQKIPIDSDIFKNRQWRENKKAEKSFTVAMCKKKINNKNLLLHIIRSEFNR